MSYIILAPFTNMERQTRAALNKTGRPWIGVPMPLDDSYWHLLATAWTGDRDIIIVEQDIVPTKSQLSSLVRCQEHWCAFEYAYNHRLHAGLGLCKFSAALQQEAPDAIVETSAEETEVHPRNHWCNLDDRLRRVLTRRGILQHIHKGEAVHLNPTPSHGCV